MLEDLKTLIWFLKKGPKFYPTMLALIARKFRTYRDSDKCRELAKKWCQDNLMTYEKCMDKLGYTAILEPIFQKEYIDKINSKLETSSSDFGGQGHIHLLYSVCEGLQAKKVIETGVAYGWSSASILESLSKRSGKLISVDMPMIKQANYELIGVAVKEKLYNFWELLREPDKYGLLKAIKKQGIECDLIHYDSDKSYYGRKWSQPKIWNALRKGGIFISDDIEDNLAFKEFVEENSLEYSIIEFEDKYVGIIKKNNA